MKKNPPKKFPPEKKSGKNSRFFFFDFGAKKVFDRKSFRLLLSFGAKIQMRFFKHCDDSLGFCPELDFKSAKS